MWWNYLLPSCYYYWKMLSCKDYYQVISGYRKHCQVFDGKTRNIYNLMKSSTYRSIHDHFMINFYLFIIWDRLLSSGKQSREINLTRDKNNIHCMSKTSRNNQGSSVGAVVRALPTPPLD